MSGVGDKRALAWSPSLVLQVFIVVKWNTAGRHTVQRIVQRTWLDGGTRLAFLPCLLMWRRYGLQRHSRRQHLHHRLGLRPQRIAARQLSEQQRREAMQLSGFPLQPSLPTILSNLPLQPSIPTFPANLPFQTSLSILRSKLPYNRSFNLTFNLPFNPTFNHLCFFVPSTLILRLFLMWC